MLVLASFVPLFQLSNSIIVELAKQKVPHLKYVSVLEKKSFTAASIDICTTVILNIQTAGRKVKMDTIFLGIILICNLYLFQRAGTNHVIKASDQWNNPVCKLPCIILSNILWENIHLGPRIGSRMNQAPHHHKFVPHFPLPSWDVVPAKAAKYSC